MVNTRSAVFAASLILSGLVSPAQAAMVGYDASLGGLPETQGWTYIDQGPAGAAPSVVSGVLQQGPTSFAGYQYWSQSPTFDFAAVPVAIDARLHILASTFVSNPRGGYVIGLEDSAGRVAALMIASDRLFLLNDEFTSASAIVAFDSTDGFHDYRMTAGPSGIALSIDGNPIVSVGFGALGTSPNQVWFGDGTAGGNSTSELTVLSMSEVPEPASLGLFGLAIAVSLSRRRRARQA